MSNLRVIILLLFGIFALTAVDVYLVRKGIGNGVGDRQTSLLPQLFEPNQITLAGDDGRMVRLCKDEEWRIVSPFKAAADAPMVMKLLDRLVFAPITETLTDVELTKHGRTREELSLNHPVLSAVLSDGHRVERLSFGRPTPSGEGVYVAVHGRDSVCIVPAEILSALEIDAMKLRRRELFLITPEAVSSFDIRCGNESQMVFERVGEQWKVNGNRGSAAKVKELIKALTEARANGFEWPKGTGEEGTHVPAEMLAGFGLDPEVALTITLKLFNGETRQLVLGKNKEDSVYAYLPTSGTVITLPGSLGALAAESASFFTDQRLITEDLSLVNLFTLSDSGGICTLRKDADGVWQLETPVVAAADNAAVKEILERLAAMKITETKKAGIVVSFSTNSPPVTVAAKALLGERELASLRSREILKIDPVQLKRLVVQRKGEAQGISVIYSRENKSWKVEDVSAAHEVNQENLERLAAVLNPLLAEKVVKLKVAATDLSAYGLDEPEFKLSVDQERENATRRNILLGKVTPEGGRYATVGVADAVFILPKATVEILYAPLLK